MNIPRLKSMFNDTNPIYKEVIAKNFELFLKWLNKKPFMFNKIGDRRWANDDLEEYSKCDCGKKFGLALMGVWQFRY